MKTWILRILVILSVLAAPAAAQEHGPMSHRGQNFTPRPELSQYGRPGEPETVKAREERMERERLAACERMLIENDDIPFSHWGYRHTEAHCRAWVQQLQDSTGSGCCSSPYSGECRISWYDRKTETVLIDDVVCSSKGAKVGVIDRLEADLALVCAPRLQIDNMGNRRCPSVHCVGRSPQT
jgi:hypothetical protein